MQRTLTALAVLALTGAPAAAQEPDDSAATAAEPTGLTAAEGIPDGWIMRFDRPAAGADMVDFRVMEPGWHMTTGRAGAAVFWQPGMTASGEYEVRTRMHLFDPASHAEAFGLFLGGDGLDAEDQSYVYFLVRQTGEYLIKRRAGAGTESIVGWTAHPAIPEAPVGERGPTQYDLAVRVGPTEVTFLVDGQTVHALPRAGLDTDGQVGVRVNHMLDLHIETLELDPTE